MKTLAMLTAGAALLGIAGCAPAITVREGDQSDPGLRVTLVSPGQLRAGYDDGGAITGNIESGRPFHVSPAADAVRVTLLFSAQDDESGIGGITAYVDLGFLCTPTEGSQRNGAAHFEAHWSGSAPDGASVPPIRVVGVSFSLEDMWMQSTCRNTGSGGLISGIQALYHADATNNAAPPRLTPVTGIFKMTDGIVNLR